ncbi:hypothetical protein FHX44_116230 [Pseudonocardia hierapolitana]|uniref:Ava_C0101 and related proteins n=1 Tax=Pseudonocardia hierapolitana TaxID=1128676 RepID=A0A561SZK9_9PSEU|nr:DUF5996 family protein [Pseudonocardia hierapolitana]TWF80287.1 hypothetical protein FHX44_116230 [Pseudonocardia hierapolitana]
MELFPSLPYTSWADTRDTLHRFTQLVGKVRLAASVRRNHWWNVPFHLTGRGITTRPMGLHPTFTIDFDFLAHQLVVTSLDGRSASFPLVGQSVAGFHAELQRALRGVGVGPGTVDISAARPFDLPDSDRPFAEDTEHASYDPAAVTRYWQVLSQVNQVLETFAARFSGKTSPVHHFWHTFDIALTRFSDTAVHQPPTTDPVTREAYSREVISFGFWFGDPTFPEAAFYSYTAPEPDGLADEPLPPPANWLERRPGSHLAVLTYDTARKPPDAQAAVLDFYEAAYRGGASRAGWDIARYACTDGITDPQLC